MPYTTLVAGTVITSSWANTNIRDQVVTPFANAAARTSAISSPVQGMLTYQTDKKRLEFYNGTVWQPAHGSAARAIRSTDQTFTSGVSAAVTWTSSTYDIDGMWSGVNPTRLTAPWAGIYSLSCTISWNSTTGGTSRRTGIFFNGVFEDQQRFRLESITDSEPLRQNCSTAGLKMAAGEFAEVHCFQNAGADRTIDAAISNFKMVYEGPTA